VEHTRSAFAYVFDGEGSFRDASDPQPVRTEQVGAAGVAGTEIGNRSLIQFDAGDAVVVRAGEHGIRFLLVSGRAIGEPVAWRGPIVMNTQEELRTAFGELQAGTFIKGR
jgi:redox-sensitive bicupin YhaK (pirin superfamily)